MSIIIRDIEYEIIKELGKGGFGRVILVKSKSDNKYYAIKEIIIKPEMQDKIENIKKEADILSKFNCNNIVKYYDSYLDKDKFYILMEYCAGKNLKIFIKEHNKNNELIEENIIYNIIKQICIGIKEIHNKNIIHRDLKPENIFMNEKNEIKIGDFGISKQYNPNKEYTNTIYKIGSIDYMSPEMKIKGIFNEKADMYSLGCIIYELFNLSKYYDDKEFNQIKNIDDNIYNKKWQEIINSLLQSDYNKRMNINEVYDIINDMNYKNIIIGEIYIDKDNINKDIQIINSFENCKRKYEWIDKQDGYKYENEKEIKENIVIKINEKIIGFIYYYKFKKEGKYIIEYLFKNNLTKTNHIFFYCKSLTNLDLSNFNTQNVTNMKSMFYYCESLTNLNLSNFNTQNVTDMGFMFSDCTSLTNLNLFNFNTQNVTDMRSMFCNCKSLTNLNLSNFNTQNVTNMSKMFDGCKSLTNLNLSKFNTQNVTNMMYVFCDCISLTNLNLSNFNTKNVTHMGGMFYNCESLTDLNLSKFNTQNVIYMWRMFSHCISLTDLNLSNFNTQNVIDMEKMFYNCESLTDLNLSNFNTQNVTDMIWMFYNCKSLKKSNIVTEDNEILKTFKNDNDKCFII